MSQQGVINSLPCAGQVTLIKRPHLLSLTGVDPLTHPLSSLPSAFPGIASSPYINAYSLLLTLGLSDLITILYHH